MSTQLLENPATVVPSVLDLPVLDEDNALQIAAEYVKTHIDPSLTVVKSYRPENGKESQLNWRFFIRCEEGPIAPIHVQEHGRTVAPFSEEEIRIIREKAAILKAQKVGALPCNDDGIILSEYAKRQARAYLADSLGMYFEADDPVFVAEEPPVWQVTIQYKRYSTGPFTLGLLDVNGSDGDVIPLPDEQLGRIQERLRAIIRSQT